MSFCSYYQAHVLKKDCWFLVAVLRSFEHLAFDRTLDKESNLFEFFVPQGLESYFEQLMEYFKGQGIVLDFTKMPNRLLNPKEQV